MSTIHRLAIIGSGPAGYAAAVYAARADMEPIVFAGEKSGGQLMLTTSVENFPGFPDGIMGPELMMGMRAQAERFGAVMDDRFVTKVDLSERPFKVYVAEEEFLAESVVLATGATAKMLEVPGEEMYIGRGVSTCAVCDAAFFRDKKVYVVGGGDAAMEDTLALTRFTDDITLIHRRDELRASRVMQKRVLEDNKDKVSVLWNSEVVEVLGNGQMIEGIRVKNTETGEESELSADGLFIAIGHTPATKFLGDEVLLDDKGYVVTGLGLSKQGVKMAEERITGKDLVAHPTMTSVEGVFAGGDNVDFRWRQAITAAGMGVQAALDAEWWLERER